MNSDMKASVKNTEGRNVNELTRLVPRKSLTELLPDQFL